MFFSFLNILHILDPSVYWFLTMHAYTMVPKFLRCEIDLVTLFVLTHHSIAHELTGVRIEYFPPYSHDINPIEEAFSKIKHFLRRHQVYYSATTGDGILYDMLEILDIIDTNDAYGCFSNPGYV